MPLQPFQNQGLNLANPQQGKHFQSQLANFLSALLNQIQNGAWLAGFLVGSAQIPKALGTISTSQAVNCQNGLSVVVSLTATASITLTLNNLALGIPVFVRVLSSGATITFKMAGTVPGGGAYAVTAIGTGGTTVNMVTTGISIASGTTFALWGGGVQESGGPTLWLGEIG
jgi:hypothetical protein